MKNPKIIKKMTEDMLDDMNTIGEVSIDTTGCQTSCVDQNFDILKQFYAGTDFESEANSLCDVISSFALKNQGVQAIADIARKIQGLLKDESGDFITGFEPYDDFIVRFISMIDNGIVSKAASPDVFEPVLEDNKELPNVKRAHAKLIELEQYLEGLSVNKRQKWQDYLNDARQMAAVGSDNFNATPELEQDDMEYINESNRQKQQRSQAKDAILEGFMGV